MTADNAGVTADERERLARLSEAATPGPWRTGGVGKDDGVWSDTPTTYDTEEGFGYLVAWCHSDTREITDAAFIVAAVNYVRDMLAGIGFRPALDVAAENERLREALTALLDCPHGRLNAARKPCICVVHENARAALAAKPQAGG